HADTQDEGKVHDDDDPINCSQHVRRLLGSVMAVPGSLPNSQQNNSVPGNTGLILVLDLAQVVPGPEVAGLHWSGKTKLAEADPDLHHLRVTIEQADCLRPVSERTHPNLQGTFRVHAISRYAGWVLVNGDYIFVGQQADGFRRHPGEIIAGQKR